LREPDPGKSGHALSLPLFGRQRLGIGLWTEQTIGSVTRHWSDTTVNTASSELVMFVLAVNVAVSVQWLSRLHHHGTTSSQ